MQMSSNPPLPDPVGFAEASTREQSQAQPEPMHTDATNNASPPPTTTIPVSHSLQHGCYLAQWRSRDIEGSRFNGVLRIERHSQGITASGDLYLHQPFQTTGSPSTVIPNPEPNPSAGIPIFARSNYRYYLRITQVIEPNSSGDTLTLGFARYSFRSYYDRWNFRGNFIAQMAFKAAPVNYPSGAAYLEGEVKDSSDTVVGNLTLGWVSSYLRKATVEVDRVPLSEYPTDNGHGLDWKKVYDSVGWDVNVYESDTNIEEPSGTSWSSAEMHAAMLTRRDLADLDREWRYYLICVRLIDDGVLGIMFDWLSADSNNIPREGAGMASDIKFPVNEQRYGPLSGKRLGGTPEYFRTAVHEIGHAMGLQHNDADNGFMHSTPQIPPGYPASVPWNFNPTDVSRLRHMPDAFVLPGMMTFNVPYWSQPFYPRDRLDLSKSLALDVKPLLSAVPIGAPIRVRVTLRNTADTPLAVPGSLSLKTGNVCGSVLGPGRSRKRFQSIMRCVKGYENQMLDPGAEMTNDLTLLRGRDGALFEAPGLHQVKIDVIWEADNVPFCVSGSAPVMVQPAVTNRHAEAALKTLSTPDLLLTVVLGGDHLKAGLEALKAALADETLAPHYAVIEAKRIGRRFRTRNADPAAAVKLLSQDTVMSPSEVKRVAPLLKGVAKKASSAVDALKKAATGDKEAEEIVRKFVAES